MFWCCFYSRDRIIKIQAWATSPPTSSSVSLLHMTQKLLIYICCYPFPQRPEGHCSHLQGRYHQSGRANSYTFNTWSICKPWTLKVHRNINIHTDETNTSIYHHIGLYFINSSWWSHFNISACFQFTNLPCDVWENIYTLSYYHHQIGNMNYHPLFRVRSWNNGVRCMSFYILYKGRHFKIVSNESRSEFEIYPNASRVTSKYFEVTVESLQYGSHLKMVHRHPASASARWALGSSRSSDFLDPIASG